MNNTTTIPAQLLLSAREAAAALSVSARTLWVVTSPRGDLPCVRIGRRVLYDPCDLQDWIATRKEDGHATQS